MSELLSCMIHVGGGGVGATRKEIIKEVKYIQSSNSHHFPSQSVLCKLPTCHAFSGFSHVPIGDCVINAKLISHQSEVSL